MNKSVEAYQEPNSEKDHEHEVAQPRVEHDAHYMHWGALLCGKARIVLVVWSGPPSFGQSRCSKFSSVNRV